MNSGTGGWLKQGNHIQRVYAQLQALSIVLAQKEEGPTYYI